MTNLLLVTQDQNLCVLAREALSATVQQVFTIPPDELDLGALGNYLTRQDVNLVVLDARDTQEMALFCGQIRTLQPHIPLVVVITAVPDRDAALQAGASDFLFAPFTREQFCARLSPYLNLIELTHFNEESQLVAAQTALQMLISRIVGEKQDLQAILAQTLEQAVSLFMANQGEIWLKVDEGRKIKRYATLSASFAKHKMITRLGGQGLVGWVATQGLGIRLEDPESSPFYDSTVDQIPEMPQYSFMAVPLQHQGETIGALAIYQLPPCNLSENDKGLLDGIARIVSPVIANALMVSELRRFADQQRTLYEMSREVATGLDLDATLDLSLKWILRLCPADLGGIWLLSGEESETLRLASCQGRMVPENPLKTMPVRETLLGLVAAGGNALMINDPQHNERWQKYRAGIIPYEPRNLLFVPMRSVEATIGVLTLFNKQAGDFNLDDLTLLTTGIDLVTISIKNAELYTRMLELIQDRERLYKQELQKERLVTIGRVTASLSHGINNPLQAIRGAVSLAIEDRSDPEAISTYLKIIQDEVNRIVHVVDRMRKIYSVKQEKSETIQINQMIRDVSSMAEEELQRLSVKVKYEMDEGINPTCCATNNLQLALLSILLQLADTLGVIGGGVIFIRTSQADKECLIEYIIHVSKIPWEKFDSRFGKRHHVETMDHFLGLTAAQETIQSLHGSMELSHENDIARLAIHLNRKNSGAQDETRKNLNR
jgi:GAF domain-containing protein